LIKPLKETTVDGHTKTYSGTVINASWYTKASELLYNSWHHEGRRFRMGAAMQAPDYVQWHGIWELQHNLQEMIAWGAERGVEEAKKIYESNSPTKFFTYKIYDVPGGLYSLVTPEQFDVPMLYQVIPNYWEKVKANVKAAYEKGLITKETWERWLTR
ncbi:MAG TPA: cytochrome C, partial [Flexistipes sinusarabici]|nr:cytochrome C [Flexistipes sinusarabici]